MEPLREFWRERVMVLDGAMGTQIQGANLTLDDFAGHENCSEILNETRPEFIRGVHLAYLAAGCDAVETNTFGSNKIVLAEFGIQAETYRLSRLGAELARAACDEHARPGSPKFVLGSMGPGTKLPTLGHTDFDTIEDSYAEELRGLMDGGIDAVIIETCQDLLQTKSALAACRRVFVEKGRTLPVICQVTIETTGTMLVGSEIAAAVAVLEPYDIIDAIGINCATGPQEMSDHVRFLGRHSPKLVSVVPNAGLPQVVEGRASYPLTPRELGEWLVRFIEEDGVGIVGGCCGTTPEHIRELARAVGRRKPRPRSPVHPPALASLYSAVPIQQDASFLIIGERTNVLGSAKFKQSFLSGDMDGMVGIGREQVKEGSHVIDICADFTGRDVTKDLPPIVRSFVTQVPAPISIDSNRWEAFEPALKLIGGRPLVNSVNLEDGEERFIEVLMLLRSFGAAVVVGTIDEEGMAKEAARKVEVARRQLRIAVEVCGFRPHDIFFDPLALTIGAGQEADRGLGAETLEGIRRIKRELPGAFTTLGLSNISFGLSPAARHVLNSVYLHHAREAGLDSAIVHAGKITPLFKIDPRRREVAEDLIFDRRRPGYDPLLEFVGLFAGAKTEAQRVKAPLATVEERLQQRIIDGDRTGLETDLDAALEKMPPLSVINDILLGGMKVVGDLFASGEMQLPFVLQSAETMKAAVAYLERFMTRVAGESKGRLVLATVKGDVHDIGKNLVDIILTNNGYSVFNLGIKQPIAAILESAKAHAAHAIGLSGLLVKSTVVMRENLEEMNRQSIALPVILGGAALSRRYVEDDCRAVYKGRVDYAKDAFEGLHLMDEICGQGARRREGRAEPAARAVEAPTREAPTRPVPSGPVPSSALPPRVEKPSPGREASPRAPAKPEMAGELASELEAEIAGGPSMPPAPGAGTRRPAPEPQAAIPHRRDIRRDVEPPVPPFLGSRVLEKVPFRAILPFVNENALFKVQWQFKPKGRGMEEYHAYLDREVRPIFLRLVERCESEDLIQPRAVYGYYRCQSDGEDLIVYRPGTRDELTRFAFPRQRGKKELCISDFFASVESGRLDVVAFTAVTVGPRVSEVERKWFAENRYTDYLYLHGLGVESAEALAEYLHRQVRAELGIGREDHRDIVKLFHQHYRGSRYSFGYPACPSLEDQEKLVKILETERVGITLSEEFQLEPEQSTTALVAHHPQAKYFNV